MDEQEALRLAGGDAQKAARLVASDGSLDAMLAYRKQRFADLVERNLEPLTDYPSMEFDEAKVLQWVRLVRVGKCMAEKGTLPPSEGVQARNDGGLSTKKNYLKESTVRNLASETAVELAEYFAKYAKVVSKRDFEDGMRETAAAVGAYAQRWKQDNPDGRVALWVQKEMNRSFLWCALQAWSGIADHVDGVVGDDDIDLLKTDEAWESALLLTFDDAAYTGKQMRDRLLDQELRSFEKVVGTPFVSNKTQKTWARRAEVFTSQTGPERMLDWGKLLSKEGVPGTRQTQYFSKGWLVSKMDKLQVPTMFSHKLPDLISTPNHLFALAPFLDRERATLLINRMTLLKGCDPSQYVYDVDKPRQPDNDFLQSQGLVCPKPIYKFVRYVDPRTGEELGEAALPTAFLDA